jgi:cytoskeletal protein CcmA (bactofilin family)
MRLSGLFIISLILIAQASDINTNTKASLSETDLLLNETLNKSRTNTTNKNKNKNDNAKSNKSSTKKEKELKINSNLLITGTVRSSEIITESATITGNCNIAKDLNAKEIKADKLTTKTVITESIHSPTGILVIEGDLVINNDIASDSIALRGQSFMLDNVKQWGLVHHDDFETEKSLEGWSDKRTSKCNPNSKNSYLGGHCNFSFNEVHKTFKNLPEHTKLKITASFHMLDSWDGETAYMKVNDEIVWSRQGQHNEKGINICGGDHNDPAFNM